MSTLSNFFEYMDRFNNGKLSKEDDSLLPGHFSGGVSRETSGVCIARIVCFASLNFESSMV